MHNKYSYRITGFESDRLTRDVSLLSKQWPFEIPQENNGRPFLNRRGRLVSTEWRVAGARQLRAARAIKLQLP
jgi:hypothetical protein